MTAPKLSRSIGLVALILYGVGDILGAGIYGLVGKAAGEMGNAAWLGFMVSMCAAVFTGLSYASLGSRYPKAAGAVFVTSRAFNMGFLSYIVGLAILASGLTSMAAASHAFAGYLKGILEFLPIQVGILIFAGAVTLLVYRGIKESIWTNSLFTIIEVGGLLFIIFFGISYIGSVDYFDATSPANPTGELTFPLLVGGAVLTFYSFIGFEDMLNVAEEVIDPRKNIPRALITAIFASSVVYVLICLIAVSVMSPAELAVSSEPLVDVVRQIAPWMPTNVYGLIALIAVANTALLNFVMGSRLLYGMSDQGLFPKFFAKVHPTRLTPHRAVFLVGGILVLLTMAGNIATLARATSVLLLLCFVVVNIALMVLKNKDRIPGAFEVPLIVPALGAIICLAMLTQTRTEEWLIAGSILALISVLYFLMKPSKEALQRMGDLD